MNAVEGFLEVDESYDRVVRLKCVTVFNYTTERQNVLDAGSVRPECILTESDFLVE